MNMPVDVVAIFNTQGQIRPEYIRLEDEEHILHTYKINNIEYSKEERLAGIQSILFVCYISIQEIQKQIKLKYIIDTHKWMFVN